MKSKLVRFEYGKKKNGQFYWHIKAKNGEIIAQGEGYKRRAGVLKVFNLLFNFDTQPVLVDLDAKDKCAKGCRCSKHGINRNWP